MDGDAAGAGAGASGAGGGTSAAAVSTGGRSIWAAIGVPKSIASGGFTFE
jgi:hypothetical protein